VGGGKGRGGSWGKLVVGGWSEYWGALKVKNGFLQKVSPGGGRLQKVMLPHKNNKEGGGILTKDICHRTVHLGEGEGWEKKRWGGQRGRSGDQAHTWTTDLPLRYPGANPHKTPLPSHPHQGGEVVKKKFFH